MLIFHFFTNFVFAYSFRRAGFEHTRKIIVWRFCRRCCPIIFLSTGCNTTQNAIGNDESRNCKIRVWFSAHMFRFRKLYIVGIHSDIRCHTEHWFWMISSNFYLQVKPLSIRNLTNLIIWHMGILIKSGRLVLLLTCVIILPINKSTSPIIIYKLWSDRGRLSTYRRYETGGPLCSSKC